MKKITKILISTVIILLLLLISLPFLFKDNIRELVNDEIEKRVNLQVSYEDFSISLLKNFPNITIGLGNLTLVGKQPFEGDTLMQTKEISFTADLIKIIKNNNLSLSAVSIKNGTLKLLTDGVARVNWDIAIEKDSTNNPSEVTESTFIGSFDNVSIEDFKISYTNLADSSEFKTTIITAEAKGDFAKSITKIISNGNLDQTSYKQGHTTLIPPTMIGFNTAMSVDTEKMLFSFVKDENTFSLGGLPLSLGGDFKILDKGYDIDMEINSQDTNIETLLSFIPPKYIELSKGVKARGNLNINAKIKGNYTEDTYPAFEAKATMQDGFFHFDGMSENVSDINLLMTVDNKGGALDNTTILIEKAKLKIAQNSINAKLQLTTPISDPNVNGEIKGIIDFDKIKDAIPMKDIEISGILDMNVKFAGKMSDIEKEKYEKFKTDGNAKLTDFRFETEDFKNGVHISDANMSFAPQYINLKSFNGNIGNTDMNLQGTIANYFQYILKGEKLEGNFTMHSKQLDLNEFIDDSQQKKDTNTKEDEMELGTVKLPNNLNFTLNVIVDKLRYERMDITNVKGKIRISDSQAYLSDVAMQLLDGSMGITGSYGNTEEEKASIDINMDMKQMDIPKAYEQLNILQKMTPIMANAKGKISTDIKLKSQLFNGFTPIQETMNGKGKIYLENFLLENNKVLNNLSDLLGDKSLSNLSISKLDIKYTIKNGNVNVEPFTTRIGGKQAKIGGNYDVDGKLNFTISIQLPREDIRGSIGKQLDKMPGSDRVKDLNLGIKITGTTEKPIIAPDIEGLGKQLLGAIGNNFLDKVSKKLFGNEEMPNTTTDTILSEQKKDTTTDKSSDAVKELINDGLKNLFKKKKEK